MGISKYQHLVGQRFGNTTVIKRLREDIFQCKCDCGVFHNTIGSALVKGLCKRCVKCRKPALSHGMTHTRFYHIWQGIKARCNNPNDTGYNNYGARGVKVCKKWNNSFENFRDDMYETYKDDLELDRIDSSRDYEPENCRWATRHQQVRNKRNNFYITINGVTKILHDWATENGIKPNTATTRIVKYGWNPIRAVTETTKSKSHE